MPSTAQHGPPERANGCTRREERQWRPIRQAVGEQALAILRSFRKRGRVEQNGLRSRAEVEAGPDRKRWPGRAEVSSPKIGSHQTRRWREMDSNLRFRARSDYGRGL